MQADIALQVIDKRPEQTRTALDVISGTSSDALAELRATLAVVRRTAVDDARAPASTVARIDEVRQRMAHAGLQVQVDIVGEPRALPAAVDLAGYRIVQESLTNVLRHSDARTAIVADPRQPLHDQARRPRSRTARGLRVPVGPGAVSDRDPGCGRRPCPSTATSDPPHCVHLGLGQRTSRFGAEALVELDAVLDPEDHGDACDAEGVPVSQRGRDSPNSDARRRKPSTRW